jgi:hypothetical protein
LVELIGLIPRTALDQASTDFLGGCELFSPLLLTGIGTCPTEYMGYRSKAVTEIDGVELVRLSLDPGPELPGSELREDLLPDLVPEGRPDQLVIGERVSTTGTLGEGDHLHPVTDERGDLLDFEGVGLGQHQQFGEARHSKRCGSHVGGS